MELEMILGRREGKEGRAREGKKPEVKWND